MYLDTKAQRKNIFLPFFPLDFLSVIRVQCRSAWSLRARISENRGWQCLSKCDCLKEQVACGMHLKVQRGRKGKQVVVVIVVVVKKVSQPHGESLVRLDRFVV